VLPSIADTFKVDKFIAGKMVWFYMLPYGIAALFYGPLARSFEVRNILLICMSIFSLSNLLTGLGENIYILFFLRLLAGVSGAAIIPLALILIAKNSPEKERGRYVGGFFSFTFMASLFGLFLSGLISWRWIFLLPAIGGVFALSTIYFYLPSFLFPRENFRMQYRQALADRTVLRLFLYIFFISLFFHGIRQWLGVYFSLVNNLDQFLISMLLTTVSVSGIIGESLGGVLSDKFGRIKVINLGICLMILAVFSLMLKGGLVFLFILMFVWGLGWTFNHVGISTFLTDLPHKHLSEAASLNSSVRFLSGGLGVALGGAIMQRSFNLGFIIFGTCLIVLLIITKKLILSL
jgi:predicted MFS family arabinose efflux permease